VNNLDPDQTFLERIAQASEEAWRSNVPRDFEAAGVGGLEFQTNTRWRGGMSEAEIRRAEKTFRLTFPPDYRLFLAALHTPDPEMAGASFVGSRLVPTTGRQFPDWTGDPAHIRRSTDWSADGLIWSAEADNWWPTAWGPRPRFARNRAKRIRELVSGGPQLVPVFGHRFLVGPGDRAGNPVLSIYGSDVIVYAPNLWAYLPLELGLFELLAQTPTETNVPAIDFWQDVIDGSA
jgi:hypothetical protein